MVNYGVFANETFAFWINLWGANLKTGYFMNLWVSFKLSNGIFEDSRFWIWKDFMGSFWAEFSKMVFRKGESGELSEIFPNISETSLFGRRWNLISSHSDFLDLFRCVQNAFRSVWPVSSIFLMCYDVLECFQTCLKFWDAFGHVRPHLDMFGPVRTRSDVLRCWSPLR